MNRYRAELMALAFLMSMLLLLGGCGNTAPAPEVTSDLPEQPAEPLTYHIYVENEVLDRETVRAASPLPSSPEDPVWGTVLDRVTFYNYDLDGKANTYTVYYSPDEYGSDGRSPAGERPEEKMVADENSGDILCVYSFVFDDGGSILREKRESFTDPSTNLQLSAPLTDIFGFDGEGHLISWEREDAFAISYEYDGRGELTKKTYETENGTESTVITRDLEGKALSTVVTRTDGKIITYEFSYDETGRIISCESRGGRAGTSLELKYDQDGWPESMKVFYNGIKQKTEKYTFEKKSDELVEGRSKVVYSEADIFGGSYFSFYSPDKKTAQGNICASAGYELKVIDTRIRFVKTLTEYDYKMVPVRSEIKAESFEELDSADVFYPSLSDSYGDLPVPQPDGSRRLRKVVVSSDIGDVIGNVTNLFFDQYERPVGEICSFDLDALFSCDKVELDGKGRPVVTQNGRYTAQYSYADDMLSYSAVVDNPEFAYHSAGNYMLDDRRPAKVIAMKDNEIFDNVNYHLEYTGDGLLTKYSYPGIYEYGFSYDYEASPDGKLSAVYFNGEEFPDGRVFMSFDGHGYLTRYTKIMEHEILTVTYSYVAAD